MTVTQSKSATLSRLQRYSLPTAALSLAVMDDQDQALIGCMDGVYLVELKSGENRRLYQHDSYVSGLAVGKDQQTCISGGYDGRIIWFDLKSASVLRTVAAHNFWSWKIAISPDRQWIASATGQYLAGGYKYDPAPETEPSVKVYDAVTGEPAYQLPHLPPVQAIAFSPNGRLLSAANLMGDVRVWEVDSGRMISQWNTPDFTSWGIIKSHCYIGGIHALLFSPDSQHLLAAGMGPMRDPMAGNGRQLWQRFDLERSPVAKVDETHKGDSGEGLMEALAIHPSGDIFAMAGRLRGGQWNVGLFSLATGTCVAFHKTGSRITAAQFSADGQLLLLAGTEGQPHPKDGAYAPFGHLDLVRVDIA